MQGENASQKSTMHVGAEVGSDYLNQQVNSPYLIDSYHKTKSS
jgi:hypothetical protein